MQPTQNNMKSHQIMLWEKVKYGKAVQWDEVECGAILGDKPEKASHEIILGESWV